GGSAPRSKKKPFYPRKKLEDEEQPFDLSRYVTKAKKIVEEHINGTLDVTLYPYTTEAPVDSAESTRSLRKTAQPAWEKKRPNVKGSRLMIFIAGGVTYSEIRAMYELCHSMGRDIVIGSTHIITPRQFIFSLKDLARGPLRPIAPVIPPYQVPVYASQQQQRPGGPGGPGGPRPGGPGPGNNMMPPQGRPGGPSPQMGGQQHRPVTPGSGGAPGPGGMRTIQKDASGRFVAPPSPHGPPRSPAHPQHPPQHAPPPPEEKKKAKMFGFI
ncbi:vacuolar sorting protein VPS33/slp1, partial [Mortierella sp. AD032]